VANILERARNAINVFRDNKPVNEYSEDIGVSTSTPTFKKRFNVGTDKSIVGSIYNRIAVDASMVSLVHARQDENHNYVETIDSGLNSCLSIEANIDQSAMAFIQDGVSTLLEDGSLAIVPVDTSVSIQNNNYFDILSMRMGSVTQWYPQHARVKVYNDRTGLREEIVLRKSVIGLVQNPFYSIMNERNGVLQRLIAKLNLLDAIDQQSGSGKLDLIIQLPFVVKTEARKKQATERVKTIEDQLQGSKHGIAYTDATEKVIQLNRAVENNLMAQIEYLTKTLYGQLGISEELLNGTASNDELVLYQNRVIEPIVKALADEMKRKFLSKTAQAQGQTVMHFRNMFSLMTPDKMPDIVDKFSRNKVATANELRAVVGWKPSKDPQADTLQNANMPAEQPIDVTQDPGNLFAPSTKKEKNQNGSKPSAQ
jgi:sulfur relay (sulfurtransferase) DsrF/TusC family protein